MTSIQEGGMDGRVRLAVTRVIPDAGMELLRAAEANGEIELRVYDKEMPPSADELDALLEGADGAITILTEKITSQLLDRHPTLTVVSNFAVGYDNIDVPAATERGVAVCNTPGVLTETTADFAFTLLVAAARRVVEGVDYVRAGRWKTWGPTLLLGRDLYNATIGIVGFGRIGKEMAKRAAGFNMRILAYDAYRDEEAAKALGVTFVELDDLLSESDFVTLHCALTEETVRLIGARELEIMKKEAVLVNAARGPVVDTDALTQALRDGTIWSAALDVTDPEPLPPDHPLIAMPNCIVVPHIASATVATRNNMATLAVQNALAVLQGNTPPHCVNPEVLQA
jgi:glyoxylate reductase